MTAGPVPGREVVVTVPATSANLGPGFDALGLALDLRDQVRVRLQAPSSPAVLVHVEGEGAGALPLDGSHLVVRALHATYDRLGLDRPHLRMWCTNHIPQGRGLGSSAAAVVAGVLAARVLSGVPLDDDDVLDLAAGIEGHPDNVAGCLLGGLTIAWSEEGRSHAVRLEPAAALRAVVLVPDVELSTETARGLLPRLVPHGDAAVSTGRAALLVEALTHSLHLLLPATQDRLHQQYRAVAMPATADLVRALRSQGVAAVVSGAGPSVLALLPSDEVPDAVSSPGAGWTVRALRISPLGASVAAIS